MDKTHSEPDLDPGFTVIGYPPEKVEKDGSHRKAKPKALTRAFSSRSAADTAAEVLKKGGSDVTAIRELGKPIH